MASKHLGTLASTCYLHYAAGCKTVWPNTWRPTRLHVDVNYLINN